MDTTIILDESHFRLALDRARSLGTTPDRYLAALIEADSRSFDQILEPVPKGFESMSNDDQDGLIDRALKAARSRRGETE
jgi:hypothetical protein